MNNVDIRSPNITFPTRPTREDASKSFESRHSKEKDQPEIPNIFDTNVWYGPRRGESEYDKAMKEYGESLLPIYELCFVASPALRIARVVRLLLAEWDSIYSLQITLSRIGVYGSLKQ